MPRKTGIQKDKLYAKMVESGEAKPNPLIDHYLKMLEKYFDSDKARLNEMFFGEFAPSAKQIEQILAATKNKEWKAFLKGENDA